MTYTAVTIRTEPDDGRRWTVEVSAADPQATRHALVMLRVKLVREGPLPILVIADEPPPDDTCPDDPQGQHYVGCGCP